jgi:serine/threonine-protein kinase
MKTCPVCGVTYADSNAFCPTDGTTLRAADADGDLVGSVVADRYLVTDLLGEGGMGKVYLARHVRLPQQAAIKVLRPDQVRDAASVARFTREAANASRIDHDRVARVYDFGETSDGTVYLAMEFVAGRTLTKLIADQGALPPVRTAGLVRQIADGLDAAHRLGIVHRDLKPDNILVIEGEGAENDDRVKVVDFGIAKAFGADEGGGPALTRTGYVVGTPEFMSPEQLLGAAVDARSDVYALALVAYECLTGDLPFPRNTPDRGLTARLVDPPRRLETVAPSVPWSPAIQEVFDAALARAPEDRPASAGGFARALAAAVDAWANGRPGAVAPPANAAAGGAVTAAVAAPRPVASSATTPAVAPGGRARRGAGRRRGAAPRSRLPASAAAGGRRGRRCGCGGHLRPPRRWRAAGRTNWRGRGRRGERPQHPAGHSDRRSHGPCCCRGGCHAADNTCHPRRGA